MTTRCNKGPATGLRYHRATWHLASATWNKQMFLFFFFFFFFGEAVVLINNLSHTTTNPRVNVGNTSLFPSLSFYHKHINICLTRVLRCAARPPGPHQAAGTHKGHAEMWRGRPHSHRPKCEERVCVRTPTRSFSWRISACAEGLRPQSQSQTPVKTVSWRCTRQT